ncbi:MAG: NTP transferase domain-containing protein [Chloroflexi bacterium]|nr:NTP transferase domain-containing protein [Chloroflexota bacterium]
MNQELNIAGVISAGWTPSEDDPLAEHTQGNTKAMIPIAGKPMITYVVDAIAGSPHVKHFAIVALDPSTDVQFSVPVEYVPDAGNLIGNAVAGLEYALDHYPNLDGVLMCSSDVPTITPDIVDAFIKECFQTDHDLYYTMIERSMMEARFPESRRSYIHLREGDFAGGDIILVRPSLHVSHQELLQELAAARKSILRQARMIGLGIFIKLALRRLSLDEAVQRVSQVLNMRVRIFSFPHPEVGMDVDKPFQLDIVRAELETRA